MAYIFQLRDLIKKEDEKDPRMALLDDFKVEVKKCSENGERVLVMGDFNNGARKKYMTNWRESLYLRDAMIDNVGVYRDL